MLSPRWRKVIRDLWDYKARTLLVVLSIAVGVFAVGVIAGAQVIMTREMNADWASVTPANAILYTANFDKDLIWSVDNIPDLAKVDARRGFGARFKVGTAETAGEDQPWRQLSLIVFPDDEAISVQQLKPGQGAWPPEEREIVLERASLNWMGVKIGDTILVEGPNGKQRELRITGTVHDLTQMDASWVGRGAGYIATETLPWLGVSSDFDELYIVVAGQQGNVDHIQDVAAVVRDKVERSGRTVYFTWIPTPGEHPAEDEVKPLLLVLGALGFLSLIVSGFLVINTMQALLAHQTRQIGMMKAIGAKNGQILGLCFGVVLIYSLLALALAMPLAALGARWLSDFIAAIVNFDIVSYDPSLQVLALEVLVGLVVPLLAALYPVLSAVRTTAREAMSDYGFNEGNFGTGRIDRVLERARGLSRPLLLSLRNTFRRKGRLALTLATLILGGAIFISVFSTRASFLLTIEDIFDYVRYDTLVVFRRDYRMELIEDEALSLPGVVAAETWQFNSARRQRPDGTESDSISLRALPADSDLVNPTLVEGRWLLPEDENAVVVNTFMLKDEPDIGVGDEIELTVEGDETIWQVVGIVKGTPPAPLIHVNLPYFAKLTGSVGRGGVVFVVTQEHTAETQSDMAKTLEEHFEAAGLNVNYTQTSWTERNQVMSQFDVFIIFLLIMAVLLAFVGGIGLMGTMSLNVLERTREIGVMRAIGASGRAILQIVIVEGIVIGTLSWLIGTVLAIPISRVLSNAVGMSSINAALSWTFSQTGVWIWLALVLVLATIASLLPARKASNVRVREALSYE